MLDGFEHVLHAPVTFTFPPFQLVQPPRQVFMTGQQLTEADKRSHDGDVDLDRPRTPQHGRQHRNSLLGKGVWSLAATTPTWSCNLQSQVCKLLFRELEHEVFRKTLPITTYRQIQIASSDLIERRQIRVQHHLLPAYQQDTAFNDRSNGGRSPSVDIKASVL